MGGTDRTQTAMLSATSPSGRPRTFSVPIEPSAARSAALEPFRDSHQVLTTLEVTCNALTTLHVTWRALTAPDVSACYDTRHRL